MISVLDKVTATGLLQLQGFGKSEAINALNAADENGTYKRQEIFIASNSDGWYIITIS